jgi:beta-glucosidase-like glycosyl hydrolase
MKKRLAKSVLSLTMVAALSITTVLPSMAAQTDPDASKEREATSAEISKNAATEGMVLLDNSQGVLPIATSGSVALYGTGAYETVIGGTGSGSVNPREDAEVTVLQGFLNAKYTVVNEDFLKAREKEYEQGSEDYSQNSGGDMWGSYAHDEPLYEKADIIKAAQKANTAIYVLSRNSGEGNDRTATKGDYYLSDNEAANLALLGKTFENVIVVLNVGGVVDTNFYTGNYKAEEGETDNLNRTKIEGLDALFLMSQAGLKGGDALVEVLNGTVNPSGKLTDTWAINYTDYPSSYNFAGNDEETLEELYTDDIYVGYRYFDTFGVDVAYPFGYGESYTDFTIDVESVTADEETVTVTAKVTNTGKVAGKEVVEVYFSAPSGDLEKPYQELAGYTKTSLLAAGASEKVTVTYDTTDMSSYDEDLQAYILEKGKYVIRVGNSSRNTIEAATLNLNSAVITEQCQNNLGLTKDQMENGTYAEGTVLNNDYEEGWVSSMMGGQTWGLVAKPKYGQVAIEGVLDANSKGYGTGLEKLATSEGLTANAKTISLSSQKFADTTTHTYSKGVITTYVSEDKTTDSAKYAADKESTDTEKLETVKAAEGATLVDVANGKITMEQLVADMSNEELIDLVEGGSYDGSSTEANESLTAIIGSQASSVEGAAGETTSNLYQSRYIPNIVMSDGPAGIRITNTYSIYKQVSKDDKFDKAKTYYSLQEQPMMGGNATDDKGATEANAADLVDSNDTEDKEAPEDNFAGMRQSSYVEDKEVTEENFAEKVAEGLYTVDETYYQYCTAFPIGTMLAQTWNADVIEEVGRAIQTEMLEYGVSTWLAPGMNIHRNPLCGRNFEYYSEDPLVAGLTAAAETKGVQTTADGEDSGVGVTLKHFAFNNQESDRSGSNAVVSERAAREIYLKGFEIAVKKANPDCIMTSYNMVNGYSTFLNYGLITETLRNEWGFKGFVMTDWMSANTVYGKYSDQNSRALLMYAGNDCEMPGSNEAKLFTAMEDGTLRLGDLQRSAINMLNVIQETAVFQELKAKADTYDADEYAKSEAGQLEAAKKELQKVKDELQKAKDELDDAKAAQKKAESEKATAESEKAAAEVAKEQAVKDKDKAESDLAVANSKLDTANDELTDAKEKLEKAEQAVTDAQKKVEAAESDVKEANDKVTAANDQVTAANAQVAELTKSLNEAKANEAANAEALKKAQEEAATAKAELAAAQEPKAGKVTIKTNKTSYSVKKGKTVKITATASDGSKVTFTSKNKKVAKVNAKGKVTGVKKGSTKIVIKAGSVKKTVKVTVK